MASQSIRLSLIDQTGYLSFRDRIALHQVVVAFFLQSHRDKRTEVLNRAHLEMENLERDIESLSIYGVSGMASILYQQEVLAQSKFIANGFASIIADVQTQDVQLVGQALERLRQMFDVLCYST